MIISIIVLSIWELTQYVTQFVKNNVQKHLLRDETESEYSYNAPIIQIMKAKNIPIWVFLIYIYKM